MDAVPLHYGGTRADHIHTPPFIPPSSVPTHAGMRGTLVTPRRNPATPAYLVVVSAGARAVPSDGKAVLGKQRGGGRAGGSQARQTPESIR